MVCISIYTILYIYHHIPPQHQPPQNRKPISHSHHPLVDADLILQVVAASQLHLFLLDLPCQGALQDDHETCSNFDLEIDMGFNCFNRFNRPKGEV